MEVTKPKLDYFKSVAKGVNPMKTFLENDTDYSNKTLKALQFVLALQYVAELQEDLYHTNYFKQELKYSVNKVVKLMQPLLERELCMVVEASEEAVVNVLKHQEQLIKRIALECEPHVLCAYNDLLTRLVGMHPDDMPYVEIKKFGTFEPPTYLKVMEVLIKEFGWDNIDELNTDQQTLIKDVIGATCLLTVKTM